MKTSVLKYITPLPLAVSLLSAQLVHAQQEPVGQAPPDAINQPDVQAITEYAGVLTPRGHLVIEPSLQYSHAGVNRLTFQGIEILSTLLIGVFTAEEANRDTWTAAVTGRLGVTDRLELEAKVPYVYRSDTLFATVPTVEGSEAGQFDIDRDLSGNGLGDIELAARYQLNRGQNNWPYLIANLRYKTTTGEGPFDIRRDSDGIERELATGSGFHSLEPSITALYPSDPAVFFANLGYMYTKKESINKRINDDITIGDVDPGDAIRVSFGMGYAINERASFSLGYKHDFIDKTRTEFLGANGNSSTQSSRSLNIGSLLLGWSYQLKPDVSVNLGLELGVTDDAPDTVITLRVPFGMGMY